MFGTMLKNIKTYVVFVIGLVIYLAVAKISFEIKYSSPLEYTRTVTEGSEYRSTRDGYKNTTNKKDVRITETKNGFLSIKTDTVVIKTDTVVYRDYYIWH